MKFESLINGLNMAQTKYNLKLVDLYVLNKVFCAENNLATIMTIIKDAAAPASRVTIHRSIKKLCKDGFLLKKEDTKNMRLKTLEPDAKFKEFLVSLRDVDGI